MAVLELFHQGAVTRISQRRFGSLLSSTLSTGGTQRRRLRLTAHRLSLSRCHLAAMMQTGLAATSKGDLVPRLDPRQGLIVRLAQIQQHSFRFKSGGDARAPQRRSPGILSSTSFTFLARHFLLLSHEPTQPRAHVAGAQGMPLPM